MWKYKAKTDPQSSLKKPEHASVGKDKNPESALLSYVYYQHKYKSDVEDFYSVNFMRLL